MKPKSIVAFGAVAVVMTILLVALASGSDAQAQEGKKKAQRAIPTVSKKLNANYVDNLHASTSPSANKLLALDGNAKFPDTTIPDSIQRRVSGTCAAGSSIRVINANGTVTCEADDSGGGGGGGGWSLTGNAGTNPATNAVGTTDNHALAFKTNNSEWARILANGNVGLGTTTPAHHLSIQGGPLWTSNNWSGAVDMTNGSALGWKVNNAGWNYGIGHSNGGLYFFRTTSAPGTTPSSGSTDLMIDDSGNVGIGTNTPVNKLTVSGAANISSFLRVGGNSGGAGLAGDIVARRSANTGAYYFGDSPNNYLYFDGSKYLLGQSGLSVNTNGKVGIGTTAPAHLLSLIGGPLWTVNNWVGALELSNGSALGWQANSAGTHFGLGQTTGGLYFFRTPSNPGTTTNSAFYDLLISNTGKVGIGTTTPSAQLEVQSTGQTSSTDGLRVKNANGDATFLVHDDGSVWIARLNGGTTRHVCISNNSGGGHLMNCNSAAEYVPSIDTGNGYPETADIVSIAPSLQNPYNDAHGPFVVQKSQTACDSNLLGFIVKPESGADGVKKNDHYLPLAIYGYFPAKVTMENGFVKRGDPLTSSSKPGYAMKATGACKIIGYALEGATQEGQIQVFANTSESTAAEVEALRQENGELKARLATLEARLAALEEVLPALPTTGQNMVSNTTR